MGYTFCQMDSGRLGTFDCAYYGTGKFYQIRRIELDSFGLDETLHSLEDRHCWRTIEAYCLLLPHL